MTSIDEEVEAHLEHHGVKGMKWGVRKDKGHEGEQAKTSKIAKLDKKFERNTKTLSNVIALHNRAAELTNKNDVDRINNKPEYKKASERGDFMRDTPIRQKYYKEHHDAFLDNLETAAKELGTNASGTKEYRITETSDGWDVNTFDVKHADDAIHIKVTYAENGMITHVAVDEALHVDEVGAHLAHFGVKGMRWGIRKDGQPGSSQGPSSSKPTLADPSKLSDADLRAAVNRMQLERQFSQLQQDRVKEGGDFAKQMLKEIGKTQVRRVAGKAADIAVEQALKKVGMDELAKRMKPKKK